MLLEVDETLSFGVNLVVFGHTQLSQQGDLFTIIGTSYYLLPVKTVQRR